MVEGGLGPGGHERHPNTGKGGDQTSFDELREPLTRDSITVEAILGSIGTGYLLLDRLNRLFPWSVDGWLE